MKGILFRPEVWQAKLKVLEHGEAQTRRTIKSQPYWQEPNHELEWRGRIITLESLIHFAHYQMGETVYIKEAWCESYYGKPICYKLDGNESPGPKGFWRSPVFLKAINARYFIKITGVRAERLQEITATDCEKEGLDNPCGYYCDVSVGHVDHQGTINTFAKLWDSINPKYPWESNPWVFVYSFKLEMPGD